MANTVSKDARWVSQSGTVYPDNSVEKRILKSVKSTYAPTDGGQSENGRIVYVAPVVPEEPTV